MFVVDTERSMSFFIINSSYILGVEIITPNSDITPPAKWIESRHCSISVQVNTGECFTTLIQIPKWVFVTTDFRGCKKHTSYKMTKADIIWKWVVGPVSRPWPLLLTCFNFKTSIDKYSHVWYIVGWNYSSISKLKLSACIWWNASIIAQRRSFALQLNLEGSFLAVAVFAKQTSWFRPEVRKLSFFTFSFSSDEVGNLLIHYYVAFSQPEIGKLLLIDLCYEIILFLSYKNVINHHAHSHHNVDTSHWECLRNWWNSIIHPNHRNQNHKVCRFDSWAS